MARPYAAVGLRFPNTYTSPVKKQKPTHSWLHPIHAAFVPSKSTPSLDQAARELLEEMQRMGHKLQSAPDKQTDVILTTARFGEPIPWREALLFSARRRFGLQQAPTIYTLMHIGRLEFELVFEQLRAALAKNSIDPLDFTYDDLAPSAWEVLVEQGQRGGPMLALQRRLQAQVKCLRIILFVGDEAPECAYHFDLVGAYPKSMAGNDFYSDMALRIATAIVAEEVPPIQAADEVIPDTLWQSLGAVRAMEAASQEFGNRNFFTNMIKISDLIGVRSVSEAVANQYSEGCFGTWITELGALVITATGSAHPVNKSQITEASLSVVKDHHDGLFAMQIDGKPYQVPSSETYEMVGMDRVLPKHKLNGSGEVPMVRSKLHGHRGIAAYHPDKVEYVPMSEPYFHYLVSCGTYPQAHGVVDAFSRSRALNDLSDSRQVVFTILPGHGVFIVEKWVEGTQPFQTIWEYFDVGYLCVSRDIPQGYMEYVRDEDGMMKLDDAI